MWSGTKRRGDILPGRSGPVNLNLFLSLSFSSEDEFQGTLLFVKGLVNRPEAFEALLIAKVGRRQGHLDASRTL